MLTSGSFLFSISIFSSWFYIIIPPPPFRLKRGLLQRIFFQDGLILLMGWHIGYRAGVWVLSIPTYFNFCPFLLNMINCRSPSGDQLIFISRNGNSLFVRIWTFSSFTERGGGVVSFIHIYAVDWRCWLPAALSTVYWNFTNQFLYLVLSSFPWTLPDCHLEICRGRLSGLDGLWIFKKVRHNQVHEVTSLHIHVSIYMVGLAPNGNFCWTQKGTEQQISSWTS